MQGSIDLIFVWMVEIDLVFYMGRKSLGFIVMIEIDLVFVWVVKIDLFQCGGSVFPKRTKDVRA